LNKTNYLIPIARRNDFNFNEFHLSVMITNILSSTPLQNSNRGALFRPRTSTKLRQQTTKVYVKGRTEGHNVDARGNVISDKKNQGEKYDKKISNERV